MRPLQLAMLGALALVCAAPATASARVLSDEHTLSRWAHPVALAPVHTAPRAGAHVFTHLHWLTEDNLPEVYLALREATDAHGTDWVRIRLPRRPNGSTGWVRRATLGPWHEVTTLLRVNRRGLRATLYDRGRAVWRSRIGVGAPVSPTPAGHFYVRERIANPHGPGLYGPVAFGTSDYSRLTEWPGGGIVGIHGTDQPQLLPGHVSHGCIRLPNSAVRRLSRLLPIGTPVQVI
jgi:hypothetical protein